MHKTKTLTTMDLKVNREGVVELEYPDSVFISRIEEAIKSYPDFPKPGITFRDFFPILRSPTLFEGTLHLMQKYLIQNCIGIDCVVGLDSRGFLIGTPLSLKLDVPFVPVRKPGKLPGSVKREEYALEYGTDALEIQTDSIQSGHRVLIVDDLLATGGTMAAAVRLVKSLGAIVECCIVVIELKDLNGRTKVNSPIHSLFQY